MDHLDDVLSNYNVVIFDGVCKFCNGAVNFIIERDYKDNYRFVPMQSEIGQMLINQYNVPKGGEDTFALIKNGKAYLRTDAALEITKDLSGFWHLFRTTLVIPRHFRDLFYNCFASKRYILFGKSEQCIIPSADIRNKFIS